MRWLMTMVAGAAACVALSLGAETASAACVAAVKWHGMAYVGHPFDSLPKRGAALAGGVRPGCNDTGPATEPEADFPVALRRLQHVPARIAVATADEPDVAYLAPGFLLELAAHPLHAYVPRRPSAPFRCAAPAVMRGHTRWQPGAHMRFAIFTVGGGEVEVRVRASTRVRARRVAGMPYLGARDRLAVTGCRSKNGKVIGANRIRRLPRIDRARSSVCPAIATAMRTMRRAARSSR